MKTNGINTHQRELSKADLEKRTWLEVAKKFGGKKPLSIFLEVPLSTLKTWISKIDPEKGMEIPYKHVLKIASVTDFSLDELSPFTPEENYHVKLLGQKNKGFSTKKLISDISPSPRPDYRSFDNNPSMIAGTDGILITGAKQFEECQTKGLQQIALLQIDWNLLLFGVYSLHDINPDFSISERVAIGLRLDEFVGSHPGYRSDLKSKTILELKNPLHFLAPGSKWNQVKGRKDSKIAKFVCLNSQGTFLRATTVCLQGIPELIEAMNGESLSIAKAAQIARLPFEQQKKDLQEKLALLPTRRNKK